MISGQVPPLTDLQLDALTELVNLGVSRAALALRGMIHEQVELSVPNVGLISRAEAVATLAGHTQFVAVHQLFDGPIAGRALLIFPDTNSIELVRAVTHGDLSLEEVIEFEQEALVETGNVILNSCLATIANVLRCNFRSSLPELLRGSGEALLGTPSARAPQEMVLFLYITFAVRRRELGGFIALLMDVPSVTSLTHLLDDLIARTAGAVTQDGDARI